MLNVTMVLSKIVNVELSASYSDVSHLFVGFELKCLPLFVSGLNLISIALL